MASQEPVQQSAVSLNEETTQVPAQGPAAVSIADAEAESPAEQLAVAASIADNNEVNAELAEDEKYTSKIA